MECIEDCKTATPRTYNIKYLVNTKGQINNYVAMEFIMKLLEYVSCYIYVTVKQIVHVTFRGGGGGGAGK